MDDSFLDRVRSVGHWRVNYRPLRLVGQKLTLGRCREIVEQSSVSLRGWDFPHISRREDEHGGYRNHAEFVENWTEWHGFREFWRMYRSTQFLFFSALREDTMPEEHGSPTVPILNTIGTVYSVTEFVEFAHRLFSRGVYKSGAELSVTLSNTQGRWLSAGRNRVPFFDKKVTNADRIEVTRQVSPDELEEQYRSIAVDFCLDLFDRFGWNPARSQIEAEQERFYRRDWGY